MKTKLLFGILMVAVYLGMGTMFAFSGVFGLNKTMSIIIGVLMMLYGLFRAVRLYRNS